MDHAVAVVDAYLQINGYFTVAEYPVIEARGLQHYAAATDLDLLAVRFPGAGRQVPGDRGGQRFEPDEALGVGGDEVDMLIVEVKEGRAALNRAAHNPRVLRTALARFGCCPARHADATARALIATGEATTPVGHRVRMAVFSNSGDGGSDTHYTHISLGHAMVFIEAHLRQHWDVLRHAHLKHPALGYFALREKARREEGGR